MKTLITLLTLVTVIVSTGLTQTPPKTNPDVRASLTVDFFGVRSGGDSRTFVTGKDPEREYSTSSYGLVGLLKIPAGTDVTLRLGGSVGKTSVDWPEIELIPKVEDRSTNFTFRAGFTFYFTPSSSKSTRARRGRP